MQFEIEPSGDLLAGWRVELESFDWGIVAGVSLDRCEHAGLFALATADVSMANQPSNYGPCQIWFVSSGV